MLFFLWCSREISPFSSCPCSWGLGLFYWARYQGDSGAGLGSCFWPRPPFQDQWFTPDGSPPWKLFTMRLQKDIPFTSESQKLSETHQTWTIIRGWPYTEPAEENIQSHCSNEWTAINLKQTTLFLLLSVGNEIMKGNHKLSKRQH